MLVAAGADVNAAEDDKTPLSVAVHNNDVEIVRCLLSSGRMRLDIDLHEDLLTDAAIDGNLEICKALIDAGMDVNKAKRGFVTPLRNAALFSHLEVVQLLVSKGAIFNCKANQSAFFEIVLDSAKNVIEFLLESADVDVDVNMRDSKNRTPLHTAAEFDRCDICEVLLSHGADIQVIDNEGKTVLHNAAAEGSRETFNMLLSAGADILARDNEGETAADRCITEELREYLLGKEEAVRSFKRSRHDTVNSVVDDGEGDDDDEGEEENRDGEFVAKVNDK